MVTDPFAAVIGQPVAVDRLRAAATAPVHAYLLHGPHGSGKRDAALAFRGQGQVCVAVGVKVEGA